MTLDQSKVRRRQIEKFLSGNPWKLSARCHFCVFVALVTSQQSHIYAKTENPCLNSLYNVLDAEPKNLIFFISTDGRSDDTNQTFLRRSPYAGDLRRGETLTKTNFPSRPLSDLQTFSVIQSINQCWIQFNISSMES